MAKKEKNTMEEYELEEGQGGLEEFIENNGKIISTIVIILIVAIGGYLAYKHLYVKSQQKSAQAEAFVAERYFERDSFNLAINGDNNYLGFTDIIDEYGITNMANLSEYYIGISYLQKGEYDKAIEYLKKFDGKETQIGALAKGALGDAYSEKGETDKAIEAYREVAEFEGSFTSPIYLKKAALLHEENGEYEKALKIYQHIKDNYPKSPEGQNMVKYITRAKIKMQ